MPQPHIQPRTSHAYGWLWVLALIIIGAGIYWGVSGGHGNRDSAVAGVPGTGTLPIAAIQANPNGYYGQTISGTATAYQIIGPDGFWLEVDNNRIFCAADNQTTVDLPAAPAVSGNAGGNGITANANNSGSSNQVTSNTGAYGGNGPTRNLYPDEQVMVSGTIYNAAQWKNTPAKSLSDHESGALDDQKAFMYVSSLSSAPATTTTTGATTPTTTPTTTTPTTTTIPDTTSTTVVTPPVITKTTTRVQTSTNNGTPGANTPTPATTPIGANNGASSSSAVIGSASSTNSNAAGAGTAGSSMNNGTPTNNGVPANNGTSMNNPNSNNPNSNQGNGTHGARSNAGATY